jgi:hypothetical protein
MLIRPPTRIPSTPHESPAMVRDARYRLSHSTTPMYGKSCWAPKGPKRPHEGVPEPASRHRDRCECCLFPKWASAP